MKDIGILNHWMVNNYGAVFLAYALERKLLEMGYDAETISWLPDEVRYPWKLSQAKKAGIIHYLFRLGYFLVFILPREKNFRAFRARMRVSAKTYRDRTLPGIAEEYRFFLIGGDQLWNTKETYYNRNNFLPFIRNRDRKAAYAASISQDFIRREIRKQFAQDVEGFSHVTVRETNAAELIEQETGFRPERVTDSAFLLSREEWAELAEAPVRKKKYAFVYQVQSDGIVPEFAGKIAEKNGWDIVYCPFPFRCWIRCDVNPYASPERWLGMIANAEYVVTDAFHGLVFSLIFNKPFAVEISRYGQDTACRITSLLNLYSLQDRLLNKDSFDKLLKESPQGMDFEPVNRLILQERQRGEAALRKMLACVKPSDMYWGGVVEYNYTRQVICFTLAFWVRERRTV